MCMCFTCVSCKAVEPYLTNDYLNTLAYRSGISQSLNIDESIANLIDFQIIDENEVYDEYLTYDFLALTINRLLENNDTSLRSLKEKGLIKTFKKENDLVDKEIAKEVIEKAVSLINNKLIDKRQEFEYKEEIKRANKYALDNNYLITDEIYELGDLIYLEDEDVYKVVCEVNEGFYILRDADLDEIFESFIISDSCEIDLTKAIDVTEVDDSSVYLNNDRELLASNSTKRFFKDGFNISYKLAKNGISARISKNVDGLNFFFDVAVSNIKPSYVWNYSDGDIKTTYFKVDYKTVEEIGVSVGRYKNYYLDLKNLDASSFMNLSKSIIKEKADEAEATIRICQIKVPISGVPTLYLNVELLAKFYVSGKVEIVISNASSKGFEVRNGKLRLINENDHDVNLKIGGSTSSAIGLNFNIEAVKKYLMDIEGDLGIKAKVGTTIHLYDDNNHTIEESDVAYSTYDELSKENNDVKVCGDLSLYWLGKIRFNTSRTLLYKFGLSRDIDILDDKNQVFGNKSHIENFVFVDKCTRNNRLKTNNTDSTVISSDKILLNKYSKVVNINQSYTIEIKALPKGYMKADLVYESKDSSVASVSNGIVYGIKRGASEIIISTSDGKYSASLNVLVSDGG